MLRKMKNQSSEEDVLTKEQKIEKIDSKIDCLKKSLSEVKGAETEVYTRIVGYYRSVRNWNNGKFEEYKHRRPFSV